MQRRILCLLLLILALLALPVAGKEFSFPSVYITADINPDGSMWVTEQRTFRFSGQFSWVTLWVFEKGGHRISDVSVAEGGQPYTESRAETPGTFQVRPLDGKTEIAWYFRAANETRTFTIRYLVPDAVTAYSDVAELYWQFIGDDWEVATDKATVIVRLPGEVDTEDLRVWGHGPLHGEVRIVDGKSARWQIDGLPPRTMLEARMTFPLELVPEAPRLDRAGLSAILAEEEENAAQANRTRSLARADRFAGWWVAGLAILAYAVLQWLRYIKPYPSEFQGDYYRELPATYTPAELGILLRADSAAPDIAATLMDLVRREHLRIEPVSIGKGTKESWGILRPEESAAPQDELAEHERMLIDLLFNRIEPWLKEERPVSVADVNRYAQKNPMSFQVWYAQWKKAVQDAAKAHRYFDESTSKAQVRTVCVAALLMAAGVLFLILEWLLFTALSLLVGGIVLLIVGICMRRHSPTARTQFLQWQAFKRFLRHFSNLKDAPVLSLAIWEHYLVYAVTLGVASEVIKQLKVLLPDLERDPHYAHARLLMYATSSNTGRGDFTSSLTQAFVSASKAATSSNSSGSGRGGGFSSGGGGGGGGGGGRAG